MTRFVIGPDAALRLAQCRASVPARHQLLAPTLIRSQWLAHLYGQVRRAEIPRSESDRQLEYLRGLPLRLLGDRVLQRAAWKIADRFGWADTFVAEYVALTQLQADAFVCLDAELARTVAGTVKVASFDELLDTARNAGGSPPGFAPPATAGM
jgi:predicted nucleic acid-binding protein